MANSVPEEKQKLIDAMQDLAKSLLQARVKSTERIIGLRCTQGLGTAAVASFVAGKLGMPKVPGARSGAQMEFRPEGVLVKFMIPNDPVEHWSIVPYANITEIVLDPVKAQ